MTSKLSLTEWSLGAGCRTRILHARAQLTRNDGIGGFAAWMRSESGRVQALARHLFPDAMSLSTKDPVAAEKETRALIADGKPVHGARLSTDDLQCDADFIVPDPKNMKLRVYQVALRAVDLELFQKQKVFTWEEGKKRKPRKGWRHPLQSLAFRCHVVQQNWPQYQVIPFFVAPVAGRVTRIEGLHGRFKETPDGWETTDAAVIAEASHLLATFCVAGECESLTASVVQQTSELNQWLQNPTAPVLGYVCKDCPFRTTDAESGFDRCWGPHARVTPHMFDLVWMYFVQENRQPVANRLAREGRVSLWDVPEESIVGKHAERQRMQIEATRTGVEILKDELRVEMSNMQWPIHFMDIESLEPVLPVHQGAQGGLEIFQLSVHRRNHPWAALEHFEWLNTERGSPNRRFLKALRARVGDHGSTGVWSPHEEHSYKRLLSQLVNQWDDDEAGDLRWLKDYLRSGRIVDMCQMAYRNHAHPLMKGRTSLKVVVSALWSEPTPIKKQMPYANYPSEMDPYSYLKSKRQIHEGTGAMRAYVEMQNSDGVKKEKLIRELLEYCGTDSAMTGFIWDTWTHALEARAVKAEAAQSEEPLLSA